MKHLEIPTNPFFKKDASNLTVFYPWGVFGRGRILPDKVAEVKIRSFIVTFVSVSVFIGVMALFVSPYAWCLLPLLLAWYYFKVRMLVRGFPLSETKLTVKESYAKSFSAYSKFSVWVFFVFSILFFVCSIGAVVVLWMEPHSTTDRLIGIGFLLGSSAVAIGCGYGLKVRTSIDTSRAKSQDRQ